METTAGGKEHSRPSAETDVSHGCACDADDGVNKIHIP